MNCISAPVSSRAQARPEQCTSWREARWHC